MFQIKNFLFSLFITLISVISYSQQHDSLYINKLKTLKSDKLSFAYHDNVLNTSTTDFTTNNHFVIIPLIQKGDSLIYPPKSKDFKKLGINTGIFLVATVTAFGVLYIMPESVTGWNHDDMKNGGLIEKWKKNVKAGPVIDGDPFVINYIAHPYCGAVYFMTARSCGFNIVESFGYSAIMSTFFWEYGVEAFAEIPSIQDLIATPVIGSALGEGFFYAKKAILKNDRRVLNSKVLGFTSLLLLDPFNTIVDGFGYKQKIQTQVSVGPVGFNNPYIKPVLGINFVAHF